MGNPVERVHLNANRMATYRRHLALSVVTDAACEIHNYTSRRALSLGVHSDKLQFKISALTLGKPNASETLRNFSLASP